jgi:hypothetical protein
MATYTTLSALFTAVADAIRAKTGSGATIVADDFPTEIAAISGGGTPTINGRAFDCGTFTLANDQAAIFTISHSLGVKPRSAFIWAKSSDLNVGKASTQARFNLEADNTSLYSWKTMAAFVQTSDFTGIQLGNTSNNDGHCLYADSNNLTVRYSANYPMLGGVEYQWLAIAP